MTLKSVEERMETPIKHEDLPSALKNAPPEMFELWNCQAEKSEEFEGEWSDYHILMTAYHDALQRAPRTVQACESVNIVELLISELEQLADVVHQIFPGGMKEFASYVKDAQRR